MNRPSLALACAVFGVVISAPSIASAHAALSSSNPKNNAKIELMPGHVSLTLNEPIREPAFVAVIAKDGSRVNSQIINVQDKTATSEITKLAAAGAYKVNYRIVSADGHPVTGTVEFEVLKGATPTPTPTPEPATPSAPSTETDEASSAPGDSSTTTDALTIVAFFIIAMGGLVLLLRSGLKTPDSEGDLN